MQLKDLFSLFTIKSKVQAFPPEVDQLFEFLHSLINREDLTDHFFKEYQASRAMSEPERTEHCTALYTQIEDFICSNKPLVVKREFTREELRSEIPKHLNIVNIPPELRLLFMREDRQRYYLYTIELDRMVQYLVSKFGFNQFKKMIGALTLPQIGTIEIAQNGLIFKDIEVELNRNAKMRLELLHYNFKNIFTEFYQGMIKIVGPTVTLNLFTTSYNRIKSIYDYDLVTDFLDLMPGAIQEKEKLALLSRKELEERVYERTKELAEEKTKIEQRISERTQALELEKRKVDIVAQNMIEGSILLNEYLDPLFANSYALDLLKPAQNSIDNILEAFKNVFAIDAKQRFTELTSESRSEEVDSNGKVYEIFFNQVDMIPRPYHLIWIRDITQFKLLERAKSEFVSVAAHQLRTPLSGIKWTLNIMLKEDLGKISIEQKSFLMKAYESNERMIKLVNDLLTAENLESRMIAYNLSETQIFDLIENIMVEVQPMSIKNKVALKLTRSDIPKVNVDQEKMRIVFQNLLENAIKYTIEGGTVTISATSDDKHVIFNIADTGIGIPKAQQGNIFKRFYRATNAVKFKTDGTGLGLFLVKTIVESHGGQVSFTSEENKGTTFYVTLPYSIKKENHEQKNFIG